MANRAKDPTAIVEELMTCSAAEATVRISDEVRNKTLERIWDFETLLLDDVKSGLDTDIENTPYGRKLYTIKNVEGRLPELENLLSIEHMETIAFMLFNPEEMVMSQEIFFRNPGGKPIFPHQDLIYEQTPLKERILSLNISLTGLNYAEGRMSYFACKIGDILPHRFNLKSGEWNLKSPESLKQPLLHLNQHSIEAIWHTSFSIHKSRNPILSGNRGVVVRFIMHCYGSKI